MAHSKELKWISAFLAMAVCCLAAAVLACNADSLKARQEEKHASSAAVFRAVKHLTVAPAAAEKQSIRSPFIRGLAQRASTGSSDAFSDALYILIEFSGLVIILILLLRTGFVIMCRKGLSVLALSIGGNSPPAFL